MGLFLGINRGGTVTITPADGVALDVTIDGATYSEAWDSSVGATIDNWMTSYSVIVSEVHNILAVDGTSNLRLINVDTLPTGATITSENATTVSARTDSTGVGTIPLDGASYIVSGATIVLSIPSAPSSADVATFTFINAAAAVAGVSAIDEFIRKPEYTNRAQTLDLPATVALA